mgnify:CR=1 FL=1|tara:strand:+ start:1966 stop:2727 length:762 start_codon:yes stop_codon:yes gene_type:complete
MFNNFQFDKNILDIENQLIKDINNSKNFSTQKEDFEILFKSLKNFVIIHNVRKKLKENDIDYNLKVTVDGGYYFIKEMYKIHFYFIEVFLLNLENYFNNDKPVFWNDFEKNLTLLLNYYSELDKDINLPENDLLKIYYKQCFSFLGKSDKIRFFINVYGAVIDNKYQKYSDFIQDILYFCKNFRNDSINNYYLNICDQAIRFLTIRERDLMKELGLCLPRHGKLTFSRTFISTNRYRLFAKKNIDKNFSIFEK